jgi:hypothetical protein
MDLHGKGFMKRVVAVAATVGVALILYLWWRTSQLEEKIDDLRASLQTSAEESSLPRETPTQPWPVQRAPRSQSQPISGQTTSSADPEEGSGGAPPLSDSQDTAQSKEERIMRNAQKIMDSMNEAQLAEWWEQRFVRDPRDADREAFGRDVLRPAVLAALPEGAELRSLECHLEYCRLEIQYLQPTDHNVFVGQLYEAKAREIGGTMLIKYGPNGRGSFDFVVLIGTRTALMVPQ